KRTSRRSHLTVKKTKQCHKFRTSELITADNCTTTTCASSKTKPIAACPGILSTVILGAKTRVPKGAIRSRVRRTTPCEVLTTKALKKAP
ncbi:hypothetical protein HPB47_023290, partial [Ixodes persulcatus]